MEGVSLSLLSKDPNFTIVSTAYNATTERHLPVFPAFHFIYCVAHNRNAVENGELKLINHEGVHHDQWSVQWEDTCIEYNKHNTNIHAYDTLNLIGAIRKIKCNYKNDRKKWKSPKIDPFFNKPNSSKLGLFKTTTLSPLTTTVKWRVKEPP